jgi:hypothetical protein
VHELLTHLINGLDPDGVNPVLQAMLAVLLAVPWDVLTWLTVFFTVVGGWLGWRRRRPAYGLLLGFVLGPIGWWMLWRAPVRTGPPPLPPRNAPKR